MAKHRLEDAHKKADGTRIPNPKGGGHTVVAPATRSILKDGLRPGSRER